MMNQPPTGEETRPKPPDIPGGRLQVLATEHWSLLATRSLTYMESFTRASMFLTVLTGAVVALALFAQVDHFHETFVVAAILILSVVVFVGLVTMGRIAALNIENVHWVAGMNRLRHAYVEMYPDLEPYFIAGTHDDMRGILLTMDLPADAGGGALSRVAAGLLTLPAMLSIIVGVVAGVLGALVAGSFGAPTLAGIAVAAAIFLVLNIVLALSFTRAFFVYVGRMPARFPSPSKPPAAR
jgi:ABC-type transporter Mla maintaining outer membrane lipid asymmetry permease subunit MlaE